MNSATKFEIGDMSEKLAFDILDLTTNRQSYPVKFRRVADLLQKYSLDCYSRLISANGIRADTTEHKVLRFDLQTEAIALLNCLLMLTKYSLHAKLISNATAERWTGMAHNIKYMTLAWRKS